MAQAVSDPKTVLVVHQDESVRTTIGSILSSYGLSVLEVGHGHKALSLLKNDGAADCADLLVTGVKPGGVAGLTVAQVFRTKCSTARVIFVSDCEDVEAVNLESDKTWLFIPKSVLSTSLPAALASFGVAVAAREVKLSGSGTSTTTGRG